MKEVSVFDPSNFQVAPRSGRPTEKQTSSNRIFVRDGKIQVHGKEVEELECIILSWRFGNMYTNQPFVTGKVTPQECFSVGFVEDELVPHESSPNKQAKNCTDCIQNAWGSNIRGTGGKACNNRRLLGVITMDNQKKILLLSIAPTSLKSWQAYANKFKVAGTDDSYPMWVTSTKISLTDVAGDRYKFVFEPGEAVKKKHQAALEKLELEAQATLLADIPPIAVMGKKKKDKKRAKPVKTTT